MKNELAYYEIRPLVYLKNKKQTVSIKALDNNFKFYNDREYLIKIIEFCTTTNALSDENCKSVIVAPKNDKIEFDYIFENEQEYFIRIYMYTENPQWVCQLNVYCVDDDLYGKYPLKGDTHIHSNMSDGRETPQTIAAHYRKAGFDYIALTDHGLWEPSDKMIKFYNEIPVDLKMFHGEEIHPPDNKIHIVNFGGDFSINDIFKKNPQLYHDQTKEIFNQLKVKKISENINLTELASCIWVTEKIKQAKGISVFCHPLWLVNGYHVNQEMTEYLLNNNIFDAFEVCGGVSLHQNMLQGALYNDARARGKNINIVGASDSHATVNFETFNQIMTITFAKDNSFSEIQKSIKTGYSVAIDYFKGNDYRVYGSFRLSAYTTFLMDNYFPLHDEMCFEEGRLMKEFCTGDTTSVEILKLIQGRVKKFMDKCFK